MLRMQGFTVQVARSPEEAVALYAAAPDAAFIAGGTDLLPEIKLGLSQPRTLVAIGTALPATVQDEGADLVLGAGLRLEQVAALGLPALSQAAAQVGSPQVRAAGTLGGNVMLSPRCMYYNQTPAWRASLGGCMRAEGPLCRVTGSAARCVATQCSDTLPALLVLGARLRLCSPAGTREVPLADLLRYDGMRAMDLAPGELLTHVILPRPAPGTRCRVDKLAARGSIDFPMLVTAVLLRLRGAVVEELRIAVGAVSPQPRLLPVDAWVGRPLHEAAVGELADLAWQKVRPVASVEGDVAWRREVARVTVRRALESLRAEA